MKYGDHTVVEYTIKAMDQLRADYNNLNQGGVLGVTFHGTYQKEPVLDYVRPTIAQYMRDQYALKTAELTALGVTDIPPIET